MGVYRKTVSLPQTNSHVLSLNSVVRLPKVNILPLFSGEVFMAWIERRVRQDRRRYDGGPPAGVSERRFCAERRLPRVAEYTITDTEWRTYFGRQERWRNGYTMVLRDRPTDIPRRLWGDL